MWASPQSNHLAGRLRWLATFSCPVGGVVLWFSSTSTMRFKVRTCEVRNCAAPTARRKASHNRRHMAIVRRSCCQAFPVDQVFCSSRESENHSIWLRPRQAWSVPVTSAKRWQQFQFKSVVKSDGSNSRCCRIIDNLLVAGSWSTRTFSWVGMKLSLVSTLLFICFSIRIDKLRLGHMISSQQKFFVVRHRYVRQTNRFQTINCFWASLYLQILNFCYVTTQYVGFVKVWAWYHCLDVTKTMLMEIVDCLVDAWKPYWACWCTEQIRNRVSSTCHQRSGWFSLHNITHGIGRVRARAIQNILHVHAIQVAVV
jgi:hypothetical protein